MISDLTYKVVALSDVIHLDPSECVDWAIEMLELGYETPNLLMLAATAKNASYFDVKPYLHKASEELGLEIKSGEGAVISYSCYFIKEIAARKRVRQNLGELHDFCQQRDYEGIIYDFYKLYWAWDQIDYDDTNQNHYWEGVNSGNIEQVVVKYAKDWLEKNIENYTQQPI